jgi:hypothetical protein
MKYRILVIAAAFLFAQPIIGYGQRGQRGGQRGGPPVTAKAGAAIDLTGYWISVVSEDWQFRMITPPKGTYTSVPINAEGRKVADAWDPAKDEASGNQCKAYGAATVMSVPGRFHISWENDNTLRIETDAGTQTRLLHFDGAPPEAGEPTWQGYSAAKWEYATGQRATTPVQEREGNLKVVTTRLRPGYLRKNGVPYSANAVVNENYQRIKAPNGDEWLIITTIVEDPLYLTSPFITSTNLKKIADSSGWNPTSCSTK